MFDGVHRGHQAILRRASHEAARLKCRPAVLTFVEHPSRVLTPDRPVELLQTFAERRETIRRCGVRAIFGLRFTRRLANFSPAEFVSRVLLRTWNLRGVVVGENFRFGRNRAGVIDDLRTLLAPAGIRVFGVSAVRMGEKIIQSTAIRGALADGNIHDAARMSGRPMEWTGRLEKGAGVGRKLGARTINLALPNERLPRLGVYAGRVRRVTRSGGRGRARAAVMNLGVAPTVHANRRVFLEAHILDRGPVRGNPGDVWQVEMKRFLRPEKKFETVEALREAISRDIVRSRAVLGIGG